MFPCDEVSDPGLDFFASLIVRTGTLANAGQSTARDGSLGYLPQILLSCQAGKSTFSTFHAQLRWSSDFGLGNRNGNLGN